MKEEQRLRRIGPEVCGDGVGWGVSPCPSASQKQVAGAYGKPVGKRLSGWLSLVGSGDR